MTDETEATHTPTLTISYEANRLFGSWVVHDPSRLHAELMGVFEHECDAKLFAAAPEMKEELVVRTEELRLSRLEVSDHENFLAKVHIEWADEVDTLKAQNAEKLAAMEEIAKGEGPFSRDPFKHAENVIDSMKAVAVAAITNAKGETP